MGMQVPVWSPGTQYDYGSEVEYQASYDVPIDLAGPWSIVLESFILNRATTTRSSNPISLSETGRLWGRVPDEAAGDYSSHDQPHQNTGDFKSQHGHQPGGYGTEEPPHPDNEHEKPAQGWLTEKRKHELEIAGGIAAGVAVIGGGIWAYNHHENKEKEKAKEEAWRTQNANPQVYLQGAQARTDAALRGSAQTPAFWVLSRGGVPPQNVKPIRGGHEADGTPLFIARSFHAQGVHPGKAGPHLQGGAAISWGGEEISKPEHEILVGEESGVVWHTFTGRADRAIKSFGKHPVDGGRESDGKALFIARVKHEGGIVPGKIAVDQDYATFAYGGAELSASEYQILFFA